MRNQWYGDNRDLVKWGVLLHLASAYRAEKIVQVGYFRPSNWAMLEIDGKNEKLPDTVLDHFRKIGNAAKIVQTPEICVIDGEFSDRRSYLQDILKVIIASTGKSCIFFLDPDTGLAPRKPTLNHVLDSELREIWRMMKDGDVLVFYQHQTNKNNTPWIEPKRAQLEAALGIQEGSAKVARGPEIARDVVFFYCCKKGANFFKRGTE